MSNWIRITEDGLPLETPIIVKHEFGIEAIHFWNAKWRYWYSGTEVDEFVLKIATYYINTHSEFRKLTNHEHPTA